MKIRYYKGADCALFRIPPVEMDAAIERFKAALERAVLLGHDPTQAVNEVLEDKELTRNLAAGLRRNIGFQNEMRRRNMRDRSAELLDQYKNEAQAQREEVQALTQQEIDQRKTEELTAQAQLEQRLATQNATQAKLVQLREKARERIATVGGEREYEMLEYIRREMEEDAAATAPVPKLKAYEASPTAAATAATNAPQDPAAPAATAATPASASAAGGLESKLDGSTGAAPKGRVSLWRRAWRAIYNVLNYEVWPSQEEYLRRKGREEGKR